MTAVGVGEEQEEVVPLTPATVAVAETLVVPVETPVVVAETLVPVTAATAGLELDQETEEREPLETETLAVMVRFWPRGMYSEAGERVREQEEQAPQSWVPPQLSVTVPQVLVQDQEGVQE